MLIYKIGANWCAACNVMKPRWEKIYEIYNAKNIELNVVNFDYNDTSQEAEIIFTKFDIRSTKTVLPTYIFINTLNQVRQITHGILEIEKVCEIIDEVLSEDG
jgi:thiol-disulfide isomerase/thioredoxin